MAHQDHGVPNGQELEEFAQSHDLPLLTIDELYKYKLATEIFVEKTADSTMPFDEVGEHFYVILKGSVAVNVANPLIKYWRDNHREYLKLK